MRAQLDAETVRPERAAAIAATEFPHVHRDFIYDSVGRRIGSDDPDTDDRSSSSLSSRTWRYLFSRAGDLAAVRDPRGCGENFYYDLGGRLIGEQYVGCSMTSHEFQRGEDASAVDLDNTLTGAVGMSAVETSRVVDVRHFYDALPDWVSSEAVIDHEIPLPSTAHLVGRATGVVDRAQRAAVSYDDRGNAIWTARQVAVIPSAPSIDASSLGSGDAPWFTEPTVTASTVLYDTTHTYVRTAAFDHADRPTSMALPRDPDWEEDGLENAPLVTGQLTYNGRGLPSSARLTVGEEAPVQVVRRIHYLRDGLVDQLEYGGQVDETESAPLVVTSTTQYDDRRRPTRMRATRSTTGSGALGGIETIADQILVWDGASNLNAILDQRDPNDWPVGHRPQSVEIQHDSLYRVVGALFNYTAPGDGAPGAPFETLGSDDSSDWRGAAYASNQVDPMRPEPAPMISERPLERVQALSWEWDWLGNMREWTDDAQQFYERSIGDITNGYDIEQRPSALYAASNLDRVGLGNEGGFVEVGYGLGGNATRLDVHAGCEATTACVADFEDCTCTAVQHYEYQWDELDRIAEARRFDRSNGGTWTFEARQRYRYDGANVRVVKEAFDTSTGDSRVALAIYPGDFERRGLVSSGASYDHVAGTGTDPIQTETQYLVAGARMVWQHGPTTSVGTELDRNHRVTLPVGDLLHTTAATVDLLSGELLEVSTYYPNGARETLLLDDELSPTPLEPTGFTGKEADEDVGLVYFGERYLIARLGRWASPDPLHVHANGGGEALNSYHYVSGNLLAGRDPLGLQDGQRVARAAESQVGIAEPQPADATPAELAEAKRAARVAALPLRMQAAVRQALRWQPEEQFESLMAAATWEPSARIAVIGRDEHDASAVRDLIESIRVAMVLAQGFRREVQSFESSEDGTVVTFRVSSQPVRGPSGVAEHGFDRAAVADRGLAGFHDVYENELRGLNTWENRIGDQTTREQMVTHFVTEALSEARDPEGGFDTAHQRGVLLENEFRSVIGQEGDLVRRNYQADGSLVAEYDTGATERFTYTRLGLLSGQYWSAPPPPSVTLP